MKLNALLLGPEGTPYEYGIFEFLLIFPNGTRNPILSFNPPVSKYGQALIVDYPSKAPR